MAQNRGKLIKLFIGNLPNSIVHRFLEDTIHDGGISRRYNKEAEISFRIAMNYRNKINPVKTALPEKEIRNIRNEVTSKVRSKLRLRISKGYSNIDLSLIEGTVDKFLKETKVI